MRSNPGYENFLAFIFTKILQCLYLFTIPIFVLLLAVILPLKGFVPSHGSTTVVGVEFYIATIASMFIGYKWTKWFPWYRWYPTENYGVFLSQIFRATVFLLPIICGFFLGILGGSWAFVIPLLVFGGFGLILTFPTDRKVTKWKKEQAPKTN
jgi:hypothetical protein